MLDRLFSYIAPHYCCVCGKTGSILCVGCRNDIDCEPCLLCIHCGRPSLSGACPSCRLPYSRAWCYGDREGALRHIIDRYKFYNAKGAYRVLGEMLSDCVGDLPSNTVVVPVPTVHSHVRQRGYDHAKLLAQYMAKDRGLALMPLVIRTTSTKQRDASRTVRFSQAKSAFKVEATLDPDIPYLLVDDVVTTGATLYYATKALRDAGAKVVWVAVVARQPSID